MDTVTIKELDVFGLSNVLDIGKPIRLYEMQPRLLSESANFVVNPVGECFNLSVTHGGLPKDKRTPL